LITTTEGTLTRLPSPLGIVRKILFSCCSQGGAKGSTGRREKKRTERHLAGGGDGGADAEETKHVKREG
jgi:hypothetical protein